MKAIEDLKSNLESFNRTGAIDSRSYAIAMDILERLVQELESAETGSSADKESFERLAKEKLRLEQENESLSSEAAKLSKDLVRLETELESMGKTASLNKDNFERLLAEKMFFEQENATLTAQAATLSKNLNLLETRLEALEKEALVSNERFDRLVKEKLSLEQENEGLSTKAERLSKDLARLEDDLEAVEKEALVHKKSFDRLVKEKLSLEQENEGLSTKAERLSKDLARLETELESMEKDALANKESSDRLLDEKLFLEKENASLNARVTKISQEKAEIESRLLLLQKTRPAFSPANLVSSFVDSLDEIDRGLKRAPSGAKYSVGSMNVTLKTNLSLEGEELRFQMPKAEDIIPPENLSTIEFSLKEVPEKPDPAFYEELPDLEGFSKGDAEGKLLATGLLQEAVFGNGCSVPETTATIPLLSGWPVADTGASVDPFFSRILSVKVPNLLGLNLESAKKVIEMSGLKLGGVRNQPSDIKPGNVLAQSLKPGSQAELNSNISLKVSVKLKKERPEKVLSDTSREISPETPVKVSTETPSGASPEAPAVTSKPGPGLKPPVSREQPVPESPKPEVKKVPRIIGMSFEQAVETLKEDGITVGAISEISSPVSAGTVLVQSPKSGSIANAVIPVDLVVSRQPPVPPKPEVKKVPQVISLPFEQAVEILRNEGIKLGVVTEISSPVPQGTVLVQSPKSGSIANAVIPVDLVVSKQPPAPPKPEVQKVPRVIGMSFEQAVETLKEGGVNVGTISEISSHVSPGTILFQSPKSGSIANAIIPVDLVVSRQPPAPPAPEVKKVPRVVGLPFDQAVEILNGNVVNVGSITEISSPVSAGTVLVQSPKSGSIANAVIPVDLVVSKQPPAPPKPEVQKVPRVVGMSFDQAVEGLRNEGINVGAVTEISSPVSAGTVLFQSPRSGSIANSVIPVDLVVSKKPPVPPAPEVQKVPRVIGMPFKQAVVTLIEDGINVGTISEISSHFPVGTVLFQSPRSGSIANAIIPVDLVVSRQPPVPPKPEVKIVPRVVGMPFEQAVEGLRNEGINVGVVTEISSPVPQGTVLVQSPKSGSIANAIIPVDLVVSKKPPVPPAPEVKKVPRVIGMPFEQAIEALKNEGINVGSITEISSPISAGTVLVQSPKSGSIANAIIPIDLVVSKKPPAPPKPEVKKVPRVIDMPFDRAVEVLNGNGIRIGTISLISSRASPGTVLVQSPKSGSIANVVIPVDLVVSKQPPAPPKPEVKKVPRVIGMPFKQAVVTLIEAGVDVGTISEISSHISPGTILFQSPKSGSIANAIIPVDLVVSKQPPAPPKPEVKKVPRVIGMPFEQAVEALESDGINVGVVTEISSPISAGTVLFQSPKSGSIANAIIPVDLVVSRQPPAPPKPEVKKVPRVIDMPFDRAVEVLNGNGVRIGTISLISSRASPGTVLVQSPKSGSIANVVIPVDLVVSRQPSGPESLQVQNKEVFESPGKEVKKVPIVVNMNLEKAVEVLEREGLSVGNILETPSRFSPGTVLSQNPKNGCVADPRIPVDLVVSKKKSILNLRRLIRLRR